VQRVTQAIGTHTITIPAAASPPPPAAATAGAVALSVSPRQASLAGRKVKGKCVTSTTRNKKKPSCTRLIAGRGADFGDAVGAYTGLQRQRTPARPSVGADRVAVSAVRPESLGFVKSRVQFPGARRAVLALAGVAVCGDQLQHCVECGLEWFCVAFDLGEEQAAL